MLSPSSSSSKLRVTITTIGCRSNQADSAWLARSLNPSFIELVDRDEWADVHIVNSCAVTARAERDVRRAVRKARLHGGPELRVLLMGCMVTASADKLDELGPLWKVVPGVKRHTIPALLHEIATEGGAETSTEGCLLDADHLPSSLKRTRPSLRVHDGCEVGCAYCVVPSGRGLHRSMPLDEIARNLDLLASEGFCEVVICGINLGAWGRDLEPRGRLVDLLSFLENEAPLPRVRLSSIEPWALGEAEIELFGAARRLAPHLHLPLQSGDDGVLKRMKRPYRVERFRSLVWKLANARPGLAIGTDIIAGFPSEGSEAFENTLSLVEELPLAYLHAFAFSPRPGTRAATMTPVVEADEIRQRVSCLRDAGEAKRKRFVEGLIGSMVHPVFEERDDSTGLLRGTAGRFVTVTAKGPRELVGELVEVKGEGVVEGGRLRGTILAL